MDTNTTENTTETKKGMKSWLHMAIPIAVVALLVGGVVFWKSTTATILIENSHIQAPVIGIAPENPGILDEVYVKPGDIVAADTPVAEVGGQVLSTKVAGIIVSTTDTPGSLFSAAAPVVSMIDPTALRVVGTLDENKGLSDIKIGQPVSFTVDSFGSKKFVGIIDEISPTADTTGVLFKISDKRDVEQFSIKARFDVSAHPEFKNGMSAKMHVYVK